MHVACMLSLLHTQKIGTEFMFTVYSLACSISKWIQWASLWQRATLANHTMTYAIKYSYLYFYECHDHFRKQMKTFSLKREKSNYLQMRIALKKYLKKVKNLYYNYFLIKHLTSGQPIWQLLEQNDPFLYSLWHN